MRFFHLSLSSLPLFVASVAGAFDCSIQHETIGETLFTKMSVVSPELKDRFESKIDKSLTELPNGIQAQFDFSRKSLKLTTYLGREQWEAKSPYLLADLKAGSRVVLTHPSHRDPAIGKIAVSVSCK